MEKSQELNGDTSDDYGVWHIFTGLKFPNGKSCSLIPSTSNGAFFRDVLDMLGRGDCQHSVGS